MTALASPAALAYNRVAALDRPPIDEGIPMNAPIARKANLTTRLDTLYPDAAVLACEPIRLNGKNAPDVQFTGVELESYHSNDKKPRFEEVSLFALEGGGFVAAHAWHSNVEGESTFWFVDKVETVEQAMAVWDWTPVAKAFARRLKGDVTKVIVGGAV